MFAGSYDSLGYDDQRKHHSPPQRPRKDYNMMTQQERARRETNRRRREQMELKLLGSEEGIPMMAGVRRHCSEPMMLTCSNETMTRQKHSRHDFHHHDVSILPRGSSKSLFLRDETDLFGNIITPPTIIYARGVSASQDEMDRDIENHTALKSNIAIRFVQPEYMQQQQQQQHQNDDCQIRSSTYVMLQEKSEFMIEQHKETSSGKDTKKDMMEEQQPQPILKDMDIVHNQEEEDENIPAPPHMKFKEDMSDDDDDTDDFHSLWIHR
jgi:hypothetical protein